MGGAHHARIGHPGQDDIGHIAAVTPQQTLVLLAANRFADPEILSRAHYRCYHCHLTS